MTVLSKCAALSLAMVLTTPVHAQDTPVVKMLGGMCPSAYDYVENWGKTFARNAAVAMPTLRGTGPIDCESSAALVKGAHSVNASSLGAAKRTALAACNANRAAGLGRCIIIATMER